MTRAALASSSRSKNSNSTPEAFREKTLKLTPPGTTVAPRGELRPVISKTFAEAHWPARTALIGEIKMTLPFQGSRPISPLFSPGRLPFCYWTGQQDGSGYSPVRRGGLAGNKCRAAAEDWRKRGFSQ